MQERECKKLWAEKLIELVLQVPEVRKHVSEEKFLELSASIDFLKTQTHNNTAEILQLKTVHIDLNNWITTLNDENEALSKRIDNAVNDLDVAE